MHRLLRSVLFFENDHHTHKEKCLLIRPLDCIYNCGDGKKYKGPNALVDHALNECQAVARVCSICKTETTLAQKETHECLPALIQVIN